MSDTKEYIIDQAFDLFLTRSYEAVSISDISAAIGFTKGALYHHFISKEELFMAVVDKYFVIPPLDVDEETVTLLQFSNACILHAGEILNKIFSHTREFSFIDYMSFIADSFRHYKGFAEDKTKYIDSETNKFKRILDKAIERGEIRADIDTLILANSYFSTMLGMAGSIIKNYSIEKALEMLQAQFDQIYKLLKV
jgi:TetR/AcrR family transcriptional regulator, transcriptional repressor for nem operon